jgi:hypothetical protein
MTVKEARKTHPSISIVGSSLILTLRGIRSYSIKLPLPLVPDTFTKAVFALVFWDAGRGSPRSDLRNTLLDDEQGDRSKTAKSIRESGVHVLTTFKWLQKTSTASFWLRSDVIETMKQGDWKAYIWRVDDWSCVMAGVSVREHVQAGAIWTPITPSPQAKISTRPANAIGAKTNQPSSTPSIPAHISNDIDRKLVREFQIILDRLASAVAKHANEPGLPKVIAKVRQEYIHVVDELRHRADPSFTPSETTEYKSWPLTDLLHEVEDIESMVIRVNLLPEDVDCQKHICKLVSGKARSRDIPSMKSLEFMEGFDEHIAMREQYDARREKHADEPTVER